MSEYNNTNYSSRYGKEFPDKDAHEDEIWSYAISFNGYGWVSDKFKAKELENYIKHPDNTRFLDNHQKGWRTGEGDCSAVALLSCIGDGKILDEDEFELEELKAILFMEQRANRWHQDWSKESLEFARALVEKIKAMNLLGATTKKDEEEGWLKPD
jgi:hypothetical protein